MDLHIIRKFLSSGLKEQGHACGVYSLLRKEEGGKPIWKHASADLVLAPAKVGSEDGWVVARFTTYGVRKEWCMRVVSEDGVGVLTRPVLVGHDGWAAGSPPGDGESPQSREWLV